jgi:hypothetical protein
MPTHRKPKGAYSRNTPDFFSDQLYSVGIYLPLTAGANLMAPSLFNNDNQGRLLYVFGVSMFNSDNGAYGVYQYKGSFGTFQTQGYSVNANVGAGPGQGFIATNGPIVGTRVAVLCHGDGGGSWFSTFPIQIVAPGYSMIIGPVVATDLLIGAGIWYMPFPSN